MVHLKHRLASILALLCVLTLLSGCNRYKNIKNALVEANPLSSGVYHIEISGSNGLALLAYKTDVLVVGSEAQWDGLATVGAYNMAFRQECHSFYTQTVQAKQWRGKWVQSSATSPAILLAQWLQMCTQRSAQYIPTIIPISQVFPAEQGSDARAVSIQIENAPLDWNALCDAHIDSNFGSQSFLTDLTEATVTLYFDTETYTLLGVVFTAENGQNNISATITVSALDGQTMDEPPNDDTIIVAEAGEDNYALLYEEWSFSASD